jgi:hypothetical protein
LAEYKKKGKIKMDEKKIYCIIDCDYSEEKVYVLLTKAQAKAIEAFIEWAGITYDYHIEEMEDIKPVEW